MTIAGAAPLQRVASAVTRVGGHVLSSQVDVQGPQSNRGLVAATASCEMNELALQTLLFDLEAGMPFLFIDQLAVQAPSSISATADTKLRVLLSISGQWQGAK